jgi:hypothetical protein
MSGTTVTASTSVVLVPTSSNYTRPYIVTFPNISTTGRLITVRDNDGFVSTGNIIILSTTAATTFNGLGNTISITQPYGFITLASQANGTYSILNTFAFPAGQAAANVSNLNAQVVTIQSTLNMYDFGTMSTNTIYTSSGQFIFNGDYIGQVTDEQLASTVTNLGTTGYLSSIPFVYVIPPTWIAVGQSSTISQATSSGSIQYSSNAADWSNATGGKGFTRFGTAVTYGEGYYIAVGNNDSGAPNTGYNQWSFNGRDWYYSYAPSLTVTQMRTACLYANGLYHSVGCNNGVGGPNTILFSEDGRTWAPSAGTLFPATNGTGYATGITFGSGNGFAGVWVCSGVQNTLSPNFSLLWSSNGSNWNPAASVSFGVGTVTDVTFDGTKFLALCVGGTTAAARNVCISFDGSNWTNAGITGGDFNNLPRYVTGSNGVFVATTGNPGQSLVYSLDGGYSWQSNTTLSGCNIPIYKPYYDGLKWWAGVETTDGSQSIYYTTQSAPALSNWANGGLTGGFTNGAVARAFVSTDGQSNVTAILNSTIFGLSQTFTTNNLNASTISVGTAYVGELNASTLYIGVTFVSTTFETINNISTQNVDFISAGTIVSSSNFMASLSVNRMSVGQAYVAQTNMSSLNVGFLSTGQTVGGPARLVSLSTNTISSGQAFIGQLGVNIGTPSYTLDVNGNFQVRSSITGIGVVSFQNNYDVNASTNRIEFSGPRGAYMDFAAGNNDYDLRIGYFPSSVGYAEIRTKNDSSASTIAIMPREGSGRVGINTTAPTTTLDVNGNVQIRQASDSILTLYRTQNNTNFGAGLMFNLNNSESSNVRYSAIYGGIQANTAGSEVGYISLSSKYPGNDITTGNFNQTLYMFSNRVGINYTLGTYPTTALDVNGSVWARSTLYVGSNTTTNQIRFYGTTGDDPNQFTHTVIGEYLYGGTQQSELIFFKGNDATTSDGPDRVRVLASGGFRVDTGNNMSWPQGGVPPTATYQNALFVSGENGRVGINTDSPGETFHINGVLNLEAGTVQQDPSIDSANKSNTYIRFGSAGASSDRAYLRQIGGADDYHMALDLHDDETVNYSIRKVRSSLNPDTIQTLFTVNGANNRVGIMTDSPQYALDVSGNLNVTSGISTSGGIVVGGETLTGTLNVTGAATLGSLLGCAAQYETWTWNNSSVTDGWYIRLGGLLIRYTDTSPSSPDGRGSLATFSGPAFSSTDYVLTGISLGSIGGTLGINARNTNSVSVSGTNFAFALLIVGKA